MNLSTTPIRLENRYFLHINDMATSYQVISGSVHLFCCTFANDSTPSHNKNYLGSFKAGDIILGSNDINQNNVSCGFYLILDHDAKIASCQSDDLLASQDETIFAKINNYLAITAEVFAKHIFQQKHILQIGKQQQAQANYFIASKTDNIVWTKTVEQNDYQLASQTVAIHIADNAIFDAATTIDLANSNELAAALPKALSNFHYQIKNNYNNQFIASDEHRQNNFAYLQNTQQKHIENTFVHLHDSYYGEKNIIPETIVIDESLGIHRIIGQLCRLFHMPIKAKATKIIEKLNCDNWHEMEQALNIYHIRSREVTLEKNWHKQENWFMLATLLDDKKTGGQDSQQNSGQNSSQNNGRAIILQHNGRHWQFYDYKNNHWQIVDDNNIDNISKTAYMLYRSLPDEPINSGFELFKSAFYLYKKDLKLVIALGTLMGAISIVSPVFLSKLLSEALPSNNIGWIYSYLLAMFVVAVGTIFFRFTSGMSMVRIETKSSLDLHAAIWSRLLQLPMNFFDKYSVGDLSDRANMIVAIYSIWSSAVTGAILSLFSIVALYGLLFFYSPMMALVSSTLIIIMLAVVYWFYINVKIEIYELFKDKGDLDNIVFQMLSSIHKLRIAAKENTVLALWAKIYNRIVVNNRKYMLYNAAMRIFFQMIPLLSSIIIFAMTYYYLYKVPNSNFDFGSFLAFNAAFGQLTIAFIGISSVIASIIITKPMFERILPILQADVEMVDNKTVIEKVSGDVVFNNIFFRYKKEMPLVLNNFSMHIKPGEYVAIVGASGSGKSTILRLLMGFETANSGSILIDGLNLQEIELSSWRKKIGIVLQGGKIMPGSILENITAGNQTLTEQDVWHALELSGIKTEVEAMPMGIHTIISENGSNISGGQLQRLIIARALVNKPNLMFLDEATSAMDNIVQKTIQDTLEKMNITRIVIAHRLSTIKNVDRIYVMQRGQIIETGSYDELMQKRGHFFELVERQQ